MDPLILDPDVLSFITKGDTRVTFYAPLLAGKRLCVCFQTVAELRLWALVRHWGSSRHKSLDSLLEQFVELPYDSSMAQHRAKVTAHRRRLGQSIDCGDAWIAAAALRHGATLLTHNAKDFTEIPGLNLILHGN